MTIIRDSQKSLSVIMQGMLCKTTLQPLQEVMLREIESTNKYQLDVTFSFPGSIKNITEYIKAFIPNDPYYKDDINHDIEILEEELQNNQLSESS